MIVDIKYIKIDKMEIFGPINKVHNYCYLAENIFSVKEISFCKEKDLHEKKISNLFIDPTYIEKFLNISFKNYSLQIYIVCWNGIFDMVENEKYIKILKRNFKFVKLFSFENSQEVSFIDSTKMFEGKIISNNFKINNDRSLSKINGVGFVKKIKFFFPFISSIFNSLRYLNSSFDFFVNEKLVFVGSADYLDFTENLKFLSKSKNKSTQIISLSLLKELDENLSLDLNKYFSFFEDKHFIKMDTHEKNFLVHLISRYLIIRHLMNFKSFFHQNKSKERIDLLHCNIFKKITHIDFGALTGNSQNYTRSLVLNRFYKDSSLKIILFKNNVVYDSYDILKNRIFNLKKFIKDLHKFNEFDCSKKSLINHLSKLKIKYLDNN